MLPNLCNTFMPRMIARKIFIIVSSNEPKQIVPKWKMTKSENALHIGRRINDLLRVKYHWETVEAITKC